MFDEHLNASHDWMVQRKHLCWRVLLFALPSCFNRGRGLRLTRYEFKLTAVKNNLSNFSIQNGDKKGVPLAIDACFSKSKELLWTLNLVVDEFELGTLCREKAYHYSIVSFSEID